MAGRNLDRLPKATHYNFPFSVLYISVAQANCKRAVGSMADQ